MDPRSTEGAVVLTTGTVERRPFWMNRDELPTAAWLHTPVDGLVRPGGVVVCPSFGFEYAHAHRTLLHLADLLAERGSAALRLDYPGRGDSAGDESTPDLAGA